ncbi:MAG: hypothetical protein GC178_10190 [Flavobacteriales bacterium]|nr:hypothetical protein [Flavobacteriales bacterium]
MIAGLAYMGGTTFRAYNFSFDNVEEAWDITLQAQLAGYTTATLPIEVEPGNDYPDQNFTLAPMP